MSKPGDLSTLVGSAYGTPFLRSVTFLVANPVTDNFAHQRGLFHAALFSKALEASVSFLIYPEHQLSGKVARGTHLNRSKDLLKFWRACVGFVPPCGLFLIAAEIDIVKGYVNFIS
jgi:hypothetical protein